MFPVALWGALLNAYRWASNGNKPTVVWSVCQLRIFAYGRLANGAPFASCARDTTTNLSCTSETQLSKIESLGGNLPRVMW